MDNIIKNIGSCSAGLNHYYKNSITLLPEEFHTELKKIYAKELADTRRSKKQGTIDCVVFK